MVSDFGEGESRLMSVKVSIQRRGLVMCSRSCAVRFSRRRAAFVCFGVVDAAGAGVDVGLSVVSVVSVSIGSAVDGADSTGSEGPVLGSLSV